MLAVPLAFEVCSSGASSMFSGQRFLHLLLFPVFVAAFLTQASPQDSESVHIAPGVRLEKSRVPPVAGPELQNRARAIRRDVDLVLVPVTVMDVANHPVTSLGRQNFTLYEGGEPQTLRYFATEDAPISVGILLDLSFSMKDKIDTARQALHEFFTNSNPGDDYFVIGFSDRPALLADSTRSTESIESKLAFAVPSGNTALLDSIYLGLTKLRTARYQRRALVIISDGGDNHSRYDAKEIRRLVEEADVEIYALGIFSRVFRTYEESVGKGLLTRITEATGGHTVTINNLDELPDAAASISRELRNQYILGYTPSNPAFDGSWRKIKVNAVPEASGTVLHVYSKQGYLAPQRQAQAP